MKDPEKCKVKKNFCGCSTLIWTSALSLAKRECGDKRAKFKKSFEWIHKQQSSTKLFLLLRCLSELVPCGLGSTRPPSKVKSMPPHLTCHLHPLSLVTPSPHWTAAAKHLAFAAIFRFQSWSQKAFSQKEANFYWAIFPNGSLLLCWRTSKNQQLGSKLSIATKWTALSVNLIPTQTMGVALSIQKLRDNFSTSVTRNAKPHDARHQVKIHTFLQTSPTSKTAKRKKQITKKPKLLYMIRFAKKTEEK